MTGTIKVKILFWSRQFLFFIVTSAFIYCTPPHFYCTLYCTFYCTPHFYCTLPQFFTVLHHVFTVIHFFSLLYCTIFVYVYSNAFLHSTILHPRQLLVSQHCYCLPQPTEEHFTVYPSELWCVKVKIYLAQYSFDNEFNYKAKLWHYLSWPKISAENIQVSASHF